MDKSLCDNKKCPNFGRYNRWCNHATINMPEVKTINKVSETRKEQEKGYKKIRKQYLKDFPECEANIKADGHKCKGKSSEIHHRKGRLGELLTDVRYFMAVCRPCHELITKNSKYAREHNLTESRLTKPNKRA